jgi:hypothetical protein
MKSNMSMYRNLGILSYPPHLDCAGGFHDLWRPVGPPGNHRNRVSSGGAAMRHQAAFDEGCIDQSDPGNDQML